jgi:hypothetical protein
MQRFVPTPRLINVTNILSKNSKFNRQLSLNSVTIQVSNKNIIKNKTIFQK